MSQAVTPPPAAASEGWSWSKVTRRGFLTTIGWGSFMLFWANVAQSTGAFFFPQVLYEPLERFKAGKASDYGMGVNVSYQQSERVWIVRNKEGIYAFLAYCRHLGCTPNWVESERLFKCPCHGSNYDIEGDVVAGPAPAPLFRLGLRQLDDGRILVDKQSREDKPGKRETGDFFLPFKV